MVKARKRFGQHFLEPAWVAKLVHAVAVQPGERFVEIGPGTGALTVPLVQQSGRVLAIEVDRDLSAALRARALPGLTVVDGDVLAADLAALVVNWQGAPLGPEHQVRIVGNLPYNISSPILFRLLGLAASSVLVCLVFFPQERFRLPVIDPALLACASLLGARRHDAVV